MTYPEWEEKYVVKAQKLPKNSHAGKAVLVDITPGTNGGDTVKVYKGEEILHYKPVSIGDDKQVIERGNGTNISYRELKSATNQLFVSTNVSLKPREQHEIDSGVSEVLRLLNATKSKELPRIIIVSDKEMSPTTIAGYNAFSNTLFIRAELGRRKKALELQKDCACPKNRLSTLLHEFLHWQDAIKYKKKHGFIPLNYLDEIAKESKEKLATIKGMDYTEISQYAWLSLQRKKYDEVFTELRVKLILRGRGQ